MSTVIGEAPAAAPLVARTVPLADPGPLLALLPREGALAWLRRGEGIVGWGSAVTIPTSGPERFADAERAWARLTRYAVVRDEVGLPGTGPVAFGSFAFSPHSPAGGLLVVPEVVVGHREGHWWVTTVDVGAVLPRTRRPRRQVPPAPPGDVIFADGARSGPEWEGVVAAAIGRIGHGDVEKVVLARDLDAIAAQPVDPRWLLNRLAERYPGCWTFNVDGLVGATPEMLVRREKGLVTSRVLAGTIRRTGDDARDLALAATLARSSKDLEEHEYAVRSVAEALTPHCLSMNVPESPFVLHLPNVMHLATDVAAVIQDASVTSLDLAAALHPSAAVGGTPTRVATALISEIEGMDRGRYAGPVGWMDGTGDGEWGLALRSAEIAGSRVRLFAGCGIVADSDPEAELAEAQAKFVPVRDSLGGLS